MATKQESCQSLSFPILGLGFGRTRSVRFRRRQTKIGALLVAGSARVMWQREMKSNRASEPAEMPGFAGTEKHGCVELMGGTSGRVVSSRNRSSQCPVLRAIRGVLGREACDG